MSAQSQFVAKDNARSLLPGSVSIPRADGGLAAEKMEPAERYFLWVFACILVLLRVRYARTYRVDSDEFQHLHLVWGWTQGLLPYRDLFDNHAPLFQALCAPLFKLLGQRPDVLFPMRLAMIPLYGLCVWSIYRIGSRLYSARIGVWAALVAALMPRFFQTSTEFRTDDLWAAFWLLGVAVLMTGKPTPWRIFSSAFLVGLAFAVSLKTSLLLASLLMSGALLVVMGLRGRAVVSHLGPASKGLALGLIGLAIVPGIIAAFFWWQGAWTQMIYCTVEHNVVPDLKRWGRLSTNSIYFILGVPLLILATARYLSGSKAEISLRLRRAFVILVPLVYLVALYAFWPDITREDFLPYAPMLALLVVPAVFAMGERLAGPFNLRLWHWPAAVAVVELGLILNSNGLFQNQPERDYRYVSHVLQLTGPEDYFMDSKAGAIYRKRPFYYVLETITRSRVQMGLIKDTIPECLVQTKTAVVDTDFSHRYPNAEAFVSKNYIPIEAASARLSVLGQLLHSPETAPFESKKFEVAIPSTYRIVSTDPTFQCTLDGAPLSGPRFLATGPHELVCKSSTASVALFWNHAWEKGYRPLWEEAQTQSASATPSPRGKKHRQS